jgi:hypothetical protein
VRVEQTFANRIRIFVSVSESMVCAMIASPTSD